MKAIILASGIGRRLQPLTKNLPKPLIKVNKKTILEYQLDNLLKCNIKKIIITTGPFEDKISKFLHKQYKEFLFSFVNNPKYAITNYIYSLWLTRDLIDDDIILFHGDLIFSENLLRRLINGKENLVLVNKDAELPKKDFKAVIENNKVVKIGVEFFGKNAFLSQPLYKFNKRDFLIWMNAIEKEIKNGNLNIYAEDAFNKISDEITLNPLYFSDELCMEIDTPEDLKIARSMLK
jgi:phosphoenolpyruvate phosphomutase